VVYTLHAFTFLVRTVLHAGLHARTLTFSHTGCMTCLTLFDYGWLRLLPPLTLPLVLVCCPLRCPHCDIIGSLLLVWLFCYYSVRHAHARTFCKTRCCVCATFYYCCNAVACTLTYPSTPPARAQGWAGGTFRHWRAGRDVTFVPHRQQIPLHAQRPAGAAPALVPHLTALVRHTALLPRYCLPSNHLLPTRARLHAPTAAPPLPPQAGGTRTTSAHGLFILHADV